VNCYIIELRDHESRDQPQPGLFLSREGKGKEPGNEDGLLLACESSRVFLARGASAVEDAGSRKKYAAAFRRLVHYMYISFKFGFPDSSLSPSKWQRRVWALF
jgi:hypothetical protein